MEDYGIDDLRELLDQLDPQPVPERTLPPEGALVYELFDELIQ